MAGPVIADRSGESQQHNVRWSPAVTQKFSTFYKRQILTYTSFGQANYLITVYCIATSLAISCTVALAPSTMHVLTSVALGLLLASIHYGTGHMAMHALMLVPHDTHRMPSYGLGTLVAFAHHFHPKPLLTQDWQVHRIAHYFSPYTMSVPIALLGVSLFAETGMVASNWFQMLAWYMLFWIFTPLHHEWAESSGKQRVKFCWASRACMDVLGVMGLTETTKDHHSHHRHSHPTVFQDFTSFRNPLLRYMYNTWWDTVYDVLHGDPWNIYLVHSVTTILSIATVATAGDWALNTGGLTTVLALVSLFALLIPACQGKIQSAIGPLVKPKWVR